VPVCSNVGQSWPEQKQDRDLLSFLKKYAKLQKKVVASTNLMAFWVTHYKRVKNVFPIIKRCREFLSFIFLKRNLQKPTVVFSTF
jgi:hypothetical protein